MDNLSTVCVRSDNSEYKKLLIARHTKETYQYKGNNLRNLFNKIELRMKNKIIREVQSISLAISIIGTVEYTEVFSEGDFNYVIGFTSGNLSLREAILVDIHSQNAFVLINEQAITD